MPQSEAVYLFGVCFSSVKRYARAWSLTSSTEGKDDRRVEITVIVLLYRTNLPESIEARPWHLRANRLAKPLEQLELLLLAEHHLPSGGTVELENEVGLLTPELLLDLGGHPIEPCCEFLLVSAREPDARTILDFCLYGNRSVGHLHCRYASDDVLFVFHVARSFETERQRYGVRHPVQILSEGLLWQVLLEYFCGWFAVYFVDDVSL